MNRPVRMKLIGHTDPYDVGCCGEDYEYCTLCDDAENVKHHEFRRNLEEESFDNTYRVCIGRRGLRHEQEFCENVDDESAYGRHYRCLVLGPVL